MIWPRRTSLLILVQIFKDDLINVSLRNYGVFMAIRYGIYFNFGDISFYYVL